MWFTKLQLFVWMVVVIATSVASGEDVKGTSLVSEKIVTAADPGTVIVDRPGGFWSIFGKRR